MKLMVLTAGFLIASTISGTGEIGNKTEAEVDLVELNHFLDDHGREVFRQVVFFDWSRRFRRFEVRAWRLIKHPSQLPQPIDGASGYTVRWKDKATTRVVRAKSMRETWSQQDPERANRLVLPENQRRPLWEKE